MPINRFRRLATATVLALAAMIVAAQPASAQEHDLVLPAGIGCDFKLAVDNIEGPPLRREFTDRNGNTVRLFAGKSGAVTYTNLTADPDKSVSFQSRGTRLRETTDATGTLLLEYSGHVGLILFPTDVPAGPSTTQISGSLVVTVEDGVFTVQEVQGQQIDICATLA